MRRSLLPLFVLIAVLVAGLAWMRWGRAPFPAADSSLEHRSDEERARTEDASAELANVVRETGGESRTEEEAEGSEREPIGMRAAVPVLRAESNDSALVVRVVDVHGRPVPEALVLGVREGSSGFESTDERGVLRIDEPTPGRKLLTARAIGWLDSESVEVYVAAGERVEVELWLRDFGRIEGRVTSFAGRPMESWTVAIEAQRRNHGRKGVLATTDARGHFAIDEVEPGPRTLLIDPPAGARGDDGGAPVVQNSARHAVEVESFETSVVKIEVEDLGPVLVRVVVTRGRGRERGVVVRGSLRATVG
jgi:hypothetical protein